MTRTLGIAIFALLGGLPVAVSASCTPGFSKYLANKAEIQKLLMQSSANVNSSAYRNLDGDNADYRFCTAAWTFQLMRLAESKEFGILERYFASKPDETDPVFRSVAAWSLYARNPKSGLKSVKEFFATFDSAREVLFEMNEILMKEFGIEGRTLPQILKRHGSFSAIYTDILTRNYRTDREIARVFDRLLSQQDIATEYRQEYASYIRRNIPTYQQYGNLKDFVSATSK